VDEVCKERNAQGAVVNKRLSERRVVRIARLNDTARIPARDRVIERSTSPCE
jgi:hypothetical protein